jgi:hypothetical protein
VIRIVTRTDKESLVRKLLSFTHSKTLSPKVAEC